jgi:hypothetical protein
VQLNSKLAEKNMRIVDGSLVVTPDLAVKGLNVMSSAVNVEYQYYPNLKTYMVTFTAIDSKGQMVSGITYLQQVNCQKEKTVIDCDDLSTVRAIGVSGDHAAENRIAMYLVNDPLEHSLPKTLELNLR